MRGRAARFLADYPLTLYFGLLCLLVAGLVAWLHFSHHWQLDYQQLLTWVNHHQTGLFIIAAGLLGVTLIGNAIAYKQTCHLSRDDYYLWLQQRSTRTLFPFLTPLHDWLRLRITLYRWWHSQPFASSVHGLILVIAVAVSFFSARATLVRATGNCNGDLTISSNTSWTTDVCYANVVVDNSSTLTISGGVTATLSSLTVGVDPGGIGAKTATVSVQGDTLNNLGVTINVSGDVTVTATGAINADGQGYTGGTVGSPTGGGSGGGVGNSFGASTYGGGGGYGGAGGTYNTGTGGTVYGSSTNPTDLGSGGGYAATAGGPSNGGAGGGAIKLTSSGTVTVDGTLSANGDVASNGGRAGGGSGGSIWLLARTCGGGGTITANGANGGSNGGGGGGGRVYQQCTYVSNTVPTVSTSGGSGGTVSASGSSGSNVISGPVADFSVSGIGSSVTAGSTSTLTVTAVDSNGDTLTGYLGAVAFTSSDAQASLPSSYTFTTADNGSKQFSVVLKTAGVQSVTVTDQSDNTATHSQTGITVTAAALNSYSVTTPPSPTSALTAGTTISVTVTAKDAYNNTLTSFTGSVAFSSTDAQATLPPEYTFVASDNGSHLFSSAVTLKTAGSQTVTAREVSSGPVAASHSGTSSALNVSAASADHLLISNVADSATAGVALSPVISVKDAFNNIVTSFTGSIAFSSTDAQATLPADYTFVSSDNGSHNFSSAVTLKTSGAQSFAVKRTDVDQSATTSVKVSPATAAALSIAFDNLPRGNVATETKLTPTVTVLDAYGNVATNFTGTIGFRSSDSLATVPASYIFSTADQGVKTFTSGLVLRTAGAQNLTVYITAGVSTTGSKIISATTNNVTVTAGSVKQLIINAPTSATAGEAFDLSVSAADQNRNIVADYNDSVKLSSSVSNSLVPAGYTFTDADQGVKKWSPGVTIYLAGDQTVTATDSHGVSGSVNVSVTPAAMDKYTAASTVRNRSLNIGWSEKFTATDAYSNPVTPKAIIVTPSATGHTKFYTDDTYQVEAFSYAVVNGIATLYVKDTVSEKTIISVRDDYGFDGSTQAITVGNALPTGSTGTSGGVVGSLSEAPVIKQIIQATAQASQQVQTYFANQSPAVLAGTVLVSAATPIASILGFAPVGASFTTAATAAAAQGSSGFYMLFASLLPFQAKRRRASGVVRHALTALPIAGVFVELLDENGERLSRSLTDQTGRYGFLPPNAGRYQLRIDNPLYGRYLSSLIEVTDPKQQMIFDDILLLPVDSRLNARLFQAFSWVRILRVFSLLFWPSLVLGSLLTTVLLLQAVTAGRVILALLYVFFWIYKIIELKNDKPYGVVVNATTGQPIPLAVIQLTTITDSRPQIRSTITDKFGRFIFTVRPDKYKLFATKGGFWPGQASLSGDKVNLKIELSPRAEGGS